MAFRGGDAVEGVGVAEVQDVRAHARACGSLDDRGDRGALGLARPRREEVGVRRTVRVRRPVDERRVFGVHDDQRVAGLGEHRHRGLHLVDADRRELVDARVHEEALEPEDARPRRAARDRAALPGTTPPQNPTSTNTSPSAAARFTASASTVVVGGMLLSGMSTIVVTPPAAAARVADAKPSHSVRPGSLTCTCVSTSPGMSTSSSASSTVREPAMSPVTERRDAHDHAVAHADLGGRRTHRPRAPARP